MSILKFAIVIFDPHTTNNMNQLERVQRKLLRFSVYLLKIKHISIIPQYLIIINQYQIGYVFSP